MSQDTAQILHGPEDTGFYIFLRDSKDGLPRGAGEPDYAMEPGSDHDAAQALIDQGHPYPAHMVMELVRRAKERKDGHALIDVGGITLEYRDTAAPSALMGRKVREVEGGAEFVVNEIDPGEPALVGDGAGHWVESSKVELAD